MAVSAVVALASTTASYVAGTMVFSTFLATFAFNFAMGVALNALAPKPKINGAQRGYQVNSRGSALSHQIIYGKVRVGGAIVYDEVTDTNNKFLHRIIAVAGHEIESFDRIYINDSYVNVEDIDGDGNIPLVYDSDGTTSNRYDGNLRINLHLGGANQNADADLVNESAKWTSNHRLRGIAYMYVRLKFNADVYPNGVPTFTAVVKGKKVYNPATDTTEWSENPALCARDYLVSNYGLAELPSNIDDDLVNSSVIVCDDFVDLSSWAMHVGGYYRIKTIGNVDFTQYGAPENTVGTFFTATGVPPVSSNGVVETARYTCNGAFTTDLTPYDIINNLLTSMGGTLWYAQGKWRMKPAYWTTPVLDLNEDDLRSSIGLSTRHSRRDNFNVVKGTFRGEESNWQTTDYPQVGNVTNAGSFVVGSVYSISSIGTTDFTACGASSNTVGEVFTATNSGSGTGYADAYLGTDNGQESVADVDLPFTDNSVEARRIARISLESNRQQLTVTASFGLKAMQAQVGDNVRLTNSRFGWVNKEFQVLSWNFGLTDGLDLQVNMVLRETAESVFDEVDDGVVYERDNTSLLSAFEVPVPSLDAAVVTTTINTDGTAVPAIDFSWSVDNSELVDKYDFRWKLTSDTEYNSILLEEPKYRLAPALSGEAYDYIVRAVNHLGVHSVFVSSASPASTGNDGTVPNAPTNVVGEGGYSVATVTWDAPTQNTDSSAIKDLFQYKVYRGTSANPTTLVGRVSGEVFTDGGLNDSTSYYYRVKAIDFTGNESAYSSDALVTTNPALVDGADGTSVLVVYADDAVGTNQSLTAGSYEYVQYVEYVTTAPSLPVSGTFVKFVGEDGQEGDAGQSIYPIYADDGSGTGQSFSPTGKSYVTFYEATSEPTLPVTGQTFVKYVGDNGATGERGAGRWNIGVTTLPTTSSGADTDFTNAIGDPVDLDQAWFYTGTQSNPTSQTVWIYDESSDTWNLQEEVIDGDLLVDGTVTANKINVSELSAISADLGTIEVDTANIADAAISSAKIADTIQSDNYVTGSTGWQITKVGAAEFNSLVVREPMIQDGAVSEQYVANQTSGSTITIPARTLTSGTQHGPWQLIASFSRPSGDALSFDIASFIRWTCSFNSTSVPIIQVSVGILSASQSVVVDLWKEEGNADNYLPFSLPTTLDIPSGSSTISVYVRQTSGSALGNRSVPEVKIQNGYIKGTAIKK